MKVSIKNDTAKQDFMPMLKGIITVMEYGAAKYGENNWRESINKREHFEFYDRLLSAAMRHIIADEPYDKESNLRHIDHALTCLYMARCYNDNLVKINGTETFSEGNTMAKTTTTKKAVKKPAAAKKVVKTVAKKAKV